MSIDNRELVSKLGEIRERCDGLDEFTVSDGDDPIWVIDKIIERFSSDKQEQDNKKNKQFFLVNDLDMNDRYELNADTKEQAKKEAMKHLNWHIAYELI